MGKRGQNVWTAGNDEEALSRGVFNAYTRKNLRYSQVRSSSRSTRSRLSVCVLCTAYATHTAIPTHPFLLLGCAS